MSISENLTPALILESTPDAIVAIDADGQIVFVNAASECLFGFSRQELDRQPIEVLIPDWSWKRWMQPSLSQSGNRAAGGFRFKTVAIERGAKKQLMEIHLGAAECGESRAAIVTIRTALPCTDSEKPLIKTIDMLRATTAQLREHQHELRMQNEELSRTRRAAEAESCRYRELFEFAPDGYVTTDGSGLIREANKAVGQLLRRDPSRLIGKPLNAFIHENDQGAFRSLLSKLENTDDDCHAQIRLKSTVMQSLVTSISATSIQSRATNERGVRWLIRDITLSQRNEERLRILEADLAHMSRLNIMGELAAAIIHEINQPLAAIALYTGGCKSLIQEPAENLSDIEDALEKVHEQVFRVSDIVRRLKRFVAKAEPVRTRLQLNEVVDEIERLMPGEAARQRVQLRFELSEEPLDVLADRVQIQQVLVNLLRNAMDACDLSRSNPHEILVRSFCNGDIAHIEVVDDGAGIACDKIEDIFQPHFSTKADGMGVGLSISRSIIHAHKGQLWATPNENGCGMTFHFTLPIATLSDLPERQEATNRTSPAILGNNEGFFMSNESSVNRQ